MNSKNNIFPLDSDFLKKCLNDWEVDLPYVSIRELNRLVDELSAHFEVEFLRFEFGFPDYHQIKLVQKKRSEYFNTVHELLQYIHLLMESLD
jgi:hypothetical protein